MRRIVLFREVLVGDVAVRAIVYNKPDLQVGQSCRILRRDPERKQGGKVYLAEDSLGRLDRCMDMVRYLPELR